MKKLSKFIAAVFAVLLAFASCEVKTSEVNEPVLSGVKISSVDSSFSDINLNNTESKIKFTIDLPAGTKKVNVEASSDNNVSFILYFNDEEYENNEIFELSQGSNRITIEVMGTTSKKYYLYLNVPEITASEITPDEDVSIKQVRVGSKIATLNGSSYSASIQDSTDTKTVSVIITPSSSNAKVTGVSSELTLNQGNNSFTITVSNGSSSANYTLTVDYTKTVTPSYDVTVSSVKVNGIEASANGTSFTYSFPSDTAESKKALVSVTPSDSNASVSSIGPVTIVSGTPSNVSFTVTNGTASQTYTLIINYTKSVIEPDPVYDVSLKSVTVGGASVSAAGKIYTYTKKGSADSFTANIAATATDSSAIVTCSKSSVTVSDGSSENVTITVTNGTESETYTLIVKYVKRATPPAPQSTQYWTNKDGAVGTYKKISSFSDWTENERIAQGAAYDDPRTWKGVQEVPYDVYALYAAWDDTNLYLMYELCNIADDDIFMIHDYAGTDNANWDNRDIPIGFALNTGSSKCVTKPTITAQSKPIWGSIDFSDENGMDYILYHSSKYGFAEHKGSFVQVGTPGFFIADGTGFSYDKDKCLTVNKSTEKGTSGIDIRYTTGCVVTGSANLKYECTPNDNRTTSGQTGEDLMASTNYKTVSSKHNSARDMSYMYTIPLATIGITRAKLESEGIGVRQLTTNGGSLMDCLPWDPCMVDVASDECSDDKSTSAEKRDLDEMTTPQARIGAM